MAYLSGKLAKKLVESLGAGRHAMEAGFIWWLTRPVRSDGSYMPVSRQRQDELVKYFSGSDR